MRPSAELICIVDDDDSVRRALGRVVRSFGFEVQLFASSRDCLDGPYIDQASCLIADVRMPEMDGFELHALLKASGRDIPTIFISAYCDEQSNSRAESAGGIAMLDKISIIDSLHNVILKAMVKQC